MVNQFAVTSLRRISPFRPTLYFRFVRQALVIANSGAPYALKQGQAIMFLDLLSDGLQMSAYALTLWLQVDMDKRTSNNTLQHAIINLQKAGYIIRDQHTKKYSITLAGRMFLVTFNDTLEALVKAYITQLADKQEQAESERINK